MFFHTCLDLLHSTVSVNLQRTLTLSSPALLSIANFTQSGVILHTNMVQNNPTEEGGLCLCMVPDVKLNGRRLAKQHVMD